MRSLSFVALCLLSSLARAADAPEAHVWSIWEKAFTAGEKTDVNTEVTVEFTSPRGKKQPVPAFWDGGTTWRVRFRPSALGTWKYQVITQPAVKELLLSGEFTCGPANGTSQFSKHGPVRVQPGKTHLEHVDGTPFFWLGDTVWNGPMLSSKSDWDRFLVDRRKKGFSVIQFNALAPWRTAPADEKGQVAFTGRKNIVINPAYFQRLDERMKAINAHEMLAAPVLVWSLTAQDPGNYLPEEDCLKLVRYQLARYGAFDVAWLLAGDNPYKGEGAARWKRIGRAAFGDQTEAPVMTHPTGTNWPWEEWRAEKWLTVFGYQSGHGDDDRTWSWLHSGPVAQNWNKAQPRPIINLEPPYEGHNGYQSRKPHSDYNVRRAIYWSLLNAPTAGFTYGGHGIWSWQTKPDEEPRDHKGSGIARVWSEAKDLPGAGQMKHIAELMSSIRWWELRPAHDFYDAQQDQSGPATFIAAARTDKGDLALLYLPRGGQIALKKAVAQDGLKAEWFNPRTGKRQEAEQRNKTYHSPDNEDWVLILRRGVP